ncbi:nuclear pore protein 84/107 [Punctularia strigosozonata HHB-11173 SS5]|uniref:nuclear pore protein 84/107 n=1 Tax=Punctularia strigosozonata (strain HHB-11173) TaxID=741275 RepID=UPI000441736D|nr:nuclear pore protein 84/107 [Punctularia strigosozonata HHB-11173 SS5]EIN06492.1 nuclear pore protein 84/107 [Punctularia strigosozonata HHB-11173 SS5]
MTDAFYASCAQVLALCQSMKDDLAAILDPESGFAPRLQKLCEEQLEDLELNPSVHRMADTDPAMLRLESNTWALLQLLMAERKTEHTPAPSPRALLRTNPYTPTSTLAQAILASSPLLSQLVQVREWLQDTAPPPPDPGATTGYWKFTKASVMQNLRTGRRLAGDGLVREMDPDAGNREKDRKVASEDANYDKALAQALYACLRGGRLEDAVDLCRRVDQPWRAGTIRGSLLFSWDALSNNGRRNDTMDVGEASDAWKGNRRRRLWKSTCTRAALNTALPDQERVLYAALAPSPQTYNILKIACRTWEDYLWAQVSIMCEEKQSAEMLRLGFWENPNKAGLEWVDSAVWLQEPDADEEEREQEEWEREVRETLDALRSVSVQEGAPADHALHISQLHIILDRTDDLLEGFAQGLQDGTHDQSSPEFPSLSRFFAHLALFLRLIDIPTPPMATQVILESYLRVLEAAGQRDLIAMYAGALGDNAVERYAEFLASLELAVDVDERRLALTRAREHGLDIERVAIATAERTIDRALKTLPPAKGALPQVSQRTEHPNQEEVLLLRSIEWTTFLDSTYPTALEQANVILRYFLAAGKIQIARVLLTALPAELASIREPEECTDEYYCYRQLFSVWQASEKVADFEASDPRQMSRDLRTTWMSDYKAIVEQAREQFLKLLTTEWLVSNVLDTQGDRRRRDLIRIRQIYVPDLILRLHAILFNSRHEIPTNLKHALQLAITVADSRYKLYEDFTSQPGRRLGDYLQAVRQAVLGGLEGGGSDPLRVLTLLKV